MEKYYYFIVGSIYFNYIAGFAVAPPTQQSLRKSSFPLKAKSSALFVRNNEFPAHKINFRGDCENRTQITSLLFLLSGTEKRKRSFPLFCRHRKGVGFKGQRP